MAFQEELAVAFKCIRETPISEAERFENELECNAAKKATSEADAPLSTL